MKQIDKAFVIIRNYFNNKKDLGGSLYINHLRRVADFLELELKKRPSNHFYYIDISEVDINKAYIIALFHDILEDTSCTLSYLANEGYDLDIIEAVNILTRKENEDYFDYIKRIKENVYARIVKISDLNDNMNITRLNKFDDVDIKRLKKYWKSYKYLTGEIKEL